MRNSKKDVMLHAMGNCQSFLILTSVYNTVHQLLMYSIVH
jgi:hypothetical protein